MFERGSSKIRALGALLLVVCAGAVSGCGVPSSMDKAGIEDQVNYYLSIGDCGDALTEILTLYSSSQTDNTVRMLTASAYACSAGFNFYNFVQKATSANVSSNSFLFEFMAQEFPSTGPVSDPKDKVVEASDYALDALMSMITPGTVLVTGDLFNTSTENEGSLLYTDRTLDSNEYLFFLAMGVMGGYENRWGANSSGAPTAGNLPWTTYNYNSGGTAMTTDGCSYASALVNFADAVSDIPNSSVSDSQPSANDALAYVAWYLNKATNLIDPGKSFAQTIYDACNYGCQNLAPTVANGASANEELLLGGSSWASNGCNDTGVCANCPMLLRNRNNCLGTVTDQTTCAAAGVIDFVNKGAIGWQ